MAFWKTADSCSSLPSVTAVPCLSLSDSPCKAELSSINKKQAGKKLLGETDGRTDGRLTPSLTLPRRVLMCRLRLFLSPPRPVPALLWRGGLLQVPPVSQQQRPVLVRGSLWQRGGRISHPWTGELRWAERSCPYVVLENLNRLQTPVAFSLHSFTGDGVLKSE